MTEQRFELVVRWGKVLLVAGVIANLYLVMRYREICRDSAQLDQRYPQQLAVFNAETYALQAVLRDFASRAATDPGIAEILRRHTPAPAAPAKPAAKTPVKKP
jgi:hypothetical protein